MIIEELVDDDTTSNCSKFLEIIDDQEESNPSYRAPYVQ
jgi:hypothetical protein